MKASGDFVIVIDKDRHPVPYKDGDSKRGLKFIPVKKGEDIPKEFLKRIAQYNLHLVDGVIFKDKAPTNLPLELGLTPPEFLKKPKKAKAKIEYTKESLNQIYENKGFSALRKIGNTFGVKDRSSKRLIKEILKAQKQRNGNV